MLLTDRVEINITNNAELHANAQHVLALMRAARPKNTSSVYNPKQREFKVSKGVRGESSHKLSHQEKLITSQKCRSSSPDKTIRSRLC